MTDAARSLPPPTCDCGAALTQCAGCAVGDWQAAHPDCRECCPISGEAVPPELGLREALNDLEIANGCLVMIHDDLQAAGLDLSGTPPMMYNDAMRQVFVILGRKAGLVTWAEIATVVREHEARG